MESLVNIVHDDAVWDVIYLRYYMVLWSVVQAVLILTMMLVQITNQMKLQQIIMLVSKVFLLSLFKTLEFISNKNNLNIFNIWSLTIVPAPIELVTSMLVTDVGDQMFWWQVTSPKSRIRHQHQISVTNITFWHIWLEFHQDVEKCHQHTIFVINI